MQLRLITELKFGRATDLVRRLLGILPKHKQKHSIRVGKSLHKAGVGKVGIYAGLLHDYLERGGDIQTLTTHLGELNLPPQTLSIIKSLSSDEKFSGRENEPLHHLRQVFAAIRDQDLKNLICLIKIADRNDNLEKRIARAGKIGRNYKQKSLELYGFLRNYYTGEPKPFRKLTKRFERLMSESIVPVF